MSVGDHHAELESYNDAMRERQDRIAELESVLRDLLEVSFPPVGMDSEYLRQKHDEAVERAKASLRIKD